MLAVYPGLIDGMDRGDSAMIEEFEESMRFPNRVLALLVGSLAAAPAPTFAQETSE